MPTNAQQSFGQMCQLDIPIANDYKNDYPKNAN